MTYRVEQISDDVQIICGDSREIVPTLPVPGALATDPPYGMAFRSNFRAVKHDAIANDKDDAALIWCCSVPVLHSRYIFCRWDNLVSVPKPKSLVTWVKNNWSMGDLEHEHGRQTEVALFYPGPEHRFPKGRPNDVIIAPRTGNEHHPTEKPVQLMLAVLEWTEGLVLDPFCGSGTTGVAAARLGRPFVGIELDPKHFDTACRRLEKAAARPDMFAAARPEKAQQRAFL
ncbi:DNA modification methylase [Methylorubrum populi]|uniref:Methyltransferase n=1 Tax=Methylorubrum populi TaxID=223967 RepID=A0A161JMX0_9HYPH|nr:site-specific DNA-methyltransferase [Methylorubrum populi]BAU93418.1 DNA modification methylase [Methylorubrum populi]